MKTTGKIAGVCITVMSKIDFKDSRQAVEYLNSTNIPILTAFSGFDFLTETEISREVTSTLDKNIELVLFCFFHFCFIKLLLLF